MEQKLLIYGKNLFQKKVKSIRIKKEEIKIMTLFSENSYGNKGSFNYFIGYRNETNHFPAWLLIKTSSNEWMSQIF